MQIIGLIGILLLILFVVFVSSFIVAKIIAAYFLKIIDDFLTDFEKQIMDLIRWAKGLDKS